MIKNFLFAKLNVVRATAFSSANWRIRGGFSSQPQAATTLRILRALEKGKFSQGCNLCLRAQA